MEICNHKAMKLTCDVDNCDVTDKCNKEDCLAYSGTPTSTQDNGKKSNDKQIKNLNGVMKDINRQCVSLNNQIREFKKEWARDVLTDKEAGRLLIMISKLTSIRDRLNNFMEGLCENE